MTTQSSSHPMITLNGSSGGGQLLRTALSLSMITGIPFELVDIRAKRPKPGLQRQHLTCLLAASAISQAHTTGDSLGSTHIQFHPQAIQAGDYSFAIGTAGSTCLLFQTLLPALLHAKAPSSLTLTGGTHNPLAPPFEFIQHIYLPTLAKMGAKASVQLIESGFNPAGGGCFKAEISPSPTLTPYHFLQRDDLQSLQITAISRNLSKKISERLIQSALRELPNASTQIDHREPGPGHGVALLIHAQHGSSAEMFCGIGELGLSSERLAKRTANLMRHYLHSQATVGRFLADQLLLPMALAGGGSFLTNALDSHVTSNIPIIEAFLPVRFTLTPNNHLTQITCHPAPSH